MTNVVASCSLGRFRKASTRERIASEPSETTKQAHRTHPLYS